MANNSIVAGDKSVKYHLRNGSRTACNNRSVFKEEGIQFESLLETERHVAPLFLQQVWDNGVINLDIK